MTSPTFLGQKLVSEDFADKYDFSSLKMIITGGAAFAENISKTIVKKYNIQYSEKVNETLFLNYDFFISFKIDIFFCFLPL